MGDSANFKYVLHEVGDPFQTSQQHHFWGDNLQRSMLERLGQPAKLAIQKIRFIPLVSFERLASKVRRLLIASGNIPTQCSLSSTGNNFLQIIAQDLYPLYF